MRLCLPCVYRSILLVSVVSSVLLLAIVASESIKAGEKSRGNGERGNGRSEDAADGSVRRSESPDLRDSEGWLRPTAKTEREHLLAAKEKDGGSNGGQDASRYEADGRRNVDDQFKQNPTQRPNLSQGISETGQAVVLTLVDTAAAELQSLAEPRLTSELRSRSPGKNVTVKATTTTTTTTTSSITASNKTERPSERTEKADSRTVPTEFEKNSTKIASEAKGAKLGDSKASGSDEGKNDAVVVVRAEQKVIDDRTAPNAATTTAKKPEEVQGQTVKDEAVTPAVTADQEPNLTVAAGTDEAAARAKIVLGTGDESAGTLLSDSIVAPGSGDHHHHEEIPSFNEWAQKRLEEAEKKKTHPNASIQNPGGPGRGVGGMKIRSKNYASPDCGAKVVAVNPEAGSARSVLVSTRDEYMLNTCTTRIWFVVELCEAIQAKKIELANFELFSSSPKDLSVHVSDRFPTREWSPVGQFTAKDHRDIQSFTLNPHLFGKFIKVELHSHHGSEHFCPISLFRAYGTSEFEVLETETDHQESEPDDDEDDDEALNWESAGGGGDAGNLFGSARDAVLRIVKKAAEVLVKSGDSANKNNITKIQESIEGSITASSRCTSLRYMIKCPNCTDTRFAGVFELLSCRSDHLDRMLRVPLTNETMRKSPLCLRYGFDAMNLRGSRKGTKNSTETNERRGKPSRTRSLGTVATFLDSIYSPEYVIALCNVIATKERALVFNTSHEIPVNSSASVILTRIDDRNQSKFDSSDTNSPPRGAPALKNEPEIDAATSRTKYPADRTLNGQDHESSNSKETTVTAETTTSTATAAATTPTSSTSSQSPLPNSESLATKIKPTKALDRDDAKKESLAPILEPSRDPNEERLQPEILTTPSPILNVPTATTRSIENEQPSTTETTVESTMPIVVPIPAPPVNPPSHPPQDTSGAVDNAPKHNNTFGKSENHPETNKVEKAAGDQDPKFMAQDPMNLDIILSDFENDGTSIHGNANQNANINAQPTASTTPQQKESVFLRLSNRIKALERNMSLSGQYLEELSKRYKKQVEEMQRSLERALAAMGEESRKGQERESRRVEEVAALRDEITSLTQSMEILLYDRNSWRSKLSTVCQHFALVVVEMIIFIFVVSYCRRSSDFEDVESEETATASSAGGLEMENETTRRRSAGAMSACAGTARKNRKRRPSEIASRIIGTYRDLMIEDRTSQESKKEKKKRRKKELQGKTILNGDDVNNGKILFPSRRSSSSTDPMSSGNGDQLRSSQTRKRPDSAPDYSYVSTDETVLFGISSDQQRCPLEEIVRVNSSVDAPSESKDTKGTSIFRGGGILKAAKLSSPSFMRTALGARSKRNSKTTEKTDRRVVTLKSNDLECQENNKSDNGSPSSVCNNAGRYGSADESETSKNSQNRSISNESESGSSTGLTVAKKSKKSSNGGGNGGGAGGGLRKMVRKLF